MTRINVGLQPRQLTDAHLLAEHREIKRLCAMYAKFTDFNSIPKQFTLGTGHMKFFMDKGLYTYKRYIDLYNEADNRIFGIEYYGLNWRNWSEDAVNYKDYIETDRDRLLLIERIAERITQSIQIPRYYGRIVSKEYAINLLKS